MKMSLWLLALMVVLGGGCGCGSGCVCVCAMKEGGEMIASGIKKHGMKGMFVDWEPNHEGYVSVKKNSSLLSKRTTTLTHTTLGGGVKPLERGKSLRNGTTESRRATYEMSVYAGEGQFLTVLHIGTPPISFTAIVDTGSDLVWRQCMPCRQCYPQSPPAFPIFNPALSSTYHDASCSDPLCRAAQMYGGECARTCKYSSPYDDPPAYTRGDLAFDTLSISDMSGRSYQATRFGFGCSHESQGPYNFAGAGGIVGFGQGKLSLPSQLGVKKFSYCFPRIPMWSISQSDMDLQSHTQQSSGLRKSKNSVSSSSRLLLGEDATLSIDGAGINSTRILATDGSSAYYVLLLGITVGGKRLNIPSSVFTRGGTLIDSGTTFTTLPPQAFHAVYAAFTASIAQKPAKLAAPTTPPLRRNLSLCYSSLPSPVPSLSFHFKGAQVRLPTNNYFIFIDGMYCLAILESRDSLSIYGNVQQQDFHILYDLHTRHISFKPTSCSLLQG